MGEVRHTARRPRKARLRGYLTLFKAILFASFVVYALYYFSQSPFFALQGIEVRGQKHLAPGEVIRESGLCSGMNIFRLDLDQAKKRLQADPWIESAELRRQLPHQVQITIKERQPRVLLLTGQRWLVLDQNAVCIDRVDSLGFYSLPIITGLNPDTTDPGRQVSASPALLSVLAALDLSVENCISEVNISNPDNLVAYTRDNIPVYLGKSQDLHSKLATAQSLTVNFKNPRAVMYIDLRSTLAPAVKYLGPGTQ